jgi:hypothetical protein
MTKRSPCSSRAWLVNDRVLDALLDQRLLVPFLTTADCLRLSEAARSGQLAK